MNKLPAGWARTTIECILEPLDDGRLIHQGWSPQCDDSPALEDEWGVLKTTAIQPGRFVDFHSKRLPDALQPRPSLEVMPGDLLLTCAGPRTRCGVPCLVRSSRRLLMISGKIYRFRTSDHMNAAFVEAWMLTSEARLSIDRMKTGGSDSGLNLTHERFRQFEVVVAPTNEQRRVVGFLDTQLPRLDAAIASLEQVQAKLKAYRASVLKAAVEGRLVPTEAELARKEKRAYEPASVLLDRILTERRRRWEETELARMKAAGKVPKNDAWKAKYEEPAVPDTRTLPPLPEGWCWTTAASLCSGVDSGTTPSKSYFRESGTPFIKVYNLTLDDGELAFSRDPCFIDADYERTQMSRSRTLPGDVLMNIVGPPLGKVSVVPALFPYWNINQAIARFRQLPDVCSAYFVAYLQSRPCQAWLAGTAKTTTSQVNLSIVNCRLMPVPLPPRREQERIAAKTRELLGNGELARGESARSRIRINRLRQSILKWAFEGKLADQDPNDEPAEALLARIKAERETATPSKKPRGRKSRTS